MKRNGNPRFSSFTMEPPVNIFKASSVCNSFYVFLSAAKAALLPFLTLFFRLVGLTAFDTGVIMAAKTLTGFVWAPLWARCAVAYNKRRLVLVFSLFMMSIMYLSFIAVYYKVGKLDACMVSSPADGNLGGNSTGMPLGGPAVEHGAEGSMNSTAGPVTASGEESNNPGNMASESGEGSADTVTGVNTSSQTANNTDISGSGNAQGSPEESADVNQVQAEGKAPTSNPEQVQQSTPLSEHPGNHGTTGDNENKLNPTEAKRMLEEMENSLGSNSLESLNSMSVEQLEEFARTYFPEMNLTAEDIRLLKEIYMESKSGEGGKHPSRHARNLNFVFLNKLKASVGSLTATLEEQKLLLFIVVLLIVVFGEFFSSPVEKIADDAWYDFLERIDDMEKYGRQRYWGSFAFAIIPIIVGITVDFTPCPLLLHLHHFLIHFYAFGVFMAITIGIAFYFPMPPPVKQKYVSKVGKGLRLICCDCRGFLFVWTLLLAGMLYASFNNFLFWHLQDLGSQEVTMGLCVSIGAFAETPMLVFSGKLVRKLGNGGVVALSLFVLSLRLLYYGFLWTPWAVLPAEITNAFTHTALWYAVLSYDEFNQGSAMDRSVRSILSSFYFGLGFSVGSLLSGFVFQVYGAQVLYWAASVISVSWCIVYSVFQCCLPKKEKVRYIKLLRKEEDDSSEGEDDWLEMALKEQ